MSTPTIDVIIPLYNVERYIERTLRSVLAQTLLPRRVIVVDDGSTDGGVRIVEEIQRRNITTVELMILRKPNGGLSSARNHGIQHSDATYLAFLDADDLWMPTKLELQLACFERSGPDPLAMVYCRAHAIDEQDVRIPGSSTLGTEPLRGHIFDRLLVANRITGSASAVLIKRSCLETVGGFDSALSALEDFDLWLRISQSGAIDLVEEDLVALRRHDRNMQKDTVHMLRNMLVFYSKWFPHAIGRPDVLKEWGHLIAEFALRAKDPGEARRMAEAMLTTEQRRALFPRTFGSLRLHMFLKHLRKSFNRSHR